MFTEHYHVAISRIENINISNHYTFLGNCPPNPYLSQHFARSEKQVLMLAKLGRVAGEICSFSQKCVNDPT